MQCIKCGRVHHVEQEDLLEYLVDEMREVYSEYNDMPDEFRLLHDLMLIFQQIPI